MDDTESFGARAKLLSGHCSRPIVGDHFQQCLTYLSSTLACFRCIVCGIRAVHNQGSDSPFPQHIGVFFFFPFFPFAPFSLLHDHFPRIP
jgi:hypothetical protein